MLSRKFVSATAEYATYEKHVNAPYMRKVFNSENAVSTILTVTATGFYELYVNGQNITKCPLSPYVTNPDKMLFYDVYDIKPFLKEGKNVLGFILGNGMVNCIGGRIWSLDKVAYRSAPAVAFALEAEYADGTKSITEADETVLTAPSPITFDDIRCGVHYDARLEQNGWCEPEFDDSSWKPALVAAEVRGEGHIKLADPLIFSQKLTPVSVSKGHSVMKIDPEADEKLKGTDKYVREDGYIYDFGKNCALVPTLKIKGKKGQKVILQFAEMRDGDKLAWDNIDRFYPHDYAQRDIYICKGDGEETFTPPFTFHAAQYCLVMGIDEKQATAELLTANVFHSDVEKLADFSCSSEIANRLQKCVENSDLSNFIYFPLDCPHREKNGWTGDAALSAEQLLINFGVENSLKEWMRLIRASQRIDGALPGIVPTGGWGFNEWSGPAWEQVIVEIPYRIYMYRGDISCFTENADMIMRYLNYLTVIRDKRGLIDTGLGDYLQPGLVSSGHNCPVIVSGTIIAKDICEHAEFLFERANMKAQATFARMLKDEFKEAARKYLVDTSTMTVYGECQCAQAMGIYYGIFENGEKQTAYKVLLEMIKRAEDHFDCGVIGLRIIFHLLASFGDAELAWKMITRTDTPSYGVWVDKFDCNSLPESCHTDKFRGIPSFNHHFRGDISNFFITKIAGIKLNPNGDDHKFAEISPALIDELTFAEASHKTPFGEISVRWERTENGIKLTVKHPAEIKCVLHTPKGYVTADKFRTYEDSVSGTVMLVPHTVKALQPVF